MDSSGNNANRRHLRVAPRKFWPHPFAAATLLPTHLSNSISLSVAKRKSVKANGNSSGATLGFEATLWSAADKMRNNMDAAEYKHVVLGLIFLKYISDAFEQNAPRLENGPGTWTLCPK